MPGISLQKLRKLRRMSAGEVLARIAERRRIAEDQRRYRRQRNGQVELSEFSECNIVARASALLAGSDHDTRSSIEQAFPDELNTSRATARSGLQRLENGCHLIGVPFDPHAPINWHADPGSPYVWPRVIYTDVPLYDLPDGADVKNTWEVSRHQFLFTFARAWHFEGNEQAASRALAIMDDWIDNNPPYEGVNWTSSLELAVRSISWVWTVALLSNFAGFGESVRHKIQGSLYEQGRYLSRHLSLYSSPYNHLVGEAAALYMIAYLFAGTSFADDWKRLARRVLAEHGPKQFYDDGFCVEQASGYHFFTLGFLMLAVHVSHTDGEPLSELENILPTALRAGATMMRPDGTWPPVGDLDSARALPVVSENFWDFRSLLALGTVMFNMPELKTTAAQSGEELFWLLGESGLRKWNALESQTTGQHHILPNAGYVAATSQPDDRQKKSDWLLFDAGPIAAGLFADNTPSVAHGHADVFNLLLQLDGMPITADCGIERYAGDRTWVDYYRSEAAHNTLEIDGAHFVTTAGRLAWSNVCPTPQLDVRLGDDLWIMRGKVQWAENRHCQRHVLWLRNLGVWVADIVQMDTPTTVRQHWQLPSAMGVEASQISDGLPALTYPGGTMACWASAAQSNTDIVEARADSPVAWQATGYGEKTAGTRLTRCFPNQSELVIVSYFGQQPLSGTIATAGRQLRWNADQNSASAQLTSTSNQDTVVWTLETPGETIEISAGSTKASPAESDEQMAGEGDWPVQITRTPSIKR